MPWYLIADILSVQSHALLLQGIIYDILSVEPLQKVRKKGELQPHIALRRYTHNDDTNKETHDDKY